MGGSAVVRFVDDRGQARAERIARAVEDEARRIEVKYSRYRESSVVSEINRNAGRTPVAVDEETDGLVKSALDLRRLTGGRFDPTSGVLRRIWDFGSGRVPSPEEVSALLPFVDGDAVSRRDGTIFLRRAGMEIDLGGDGRRWTVGVMDPRQPGRCRLALRIPGEMGIATSGDYERGFVKNGVRYHHILDATTGWPARGIASATVLAADTFEAGRLASASFLLGAEDGLALLEAAPGVEGVLITQEGGVRATTGMVRFTDLPADAFSILSVERWRRERATA